MQASRIAASRGIPITQVLALIDDRTQPPVLGFIGQPRVNVLTVNRALDARYPVVHPKTS
jgi:K+-transporting ATPase ATPase C chain